MPDNTPIHVSILGNCMTRDILGFQLNNGGYIVDRYVQGLHPISLVSESPLIKDLPEDLDISTINFDKRNIRMDLEKTALDYLLEVNSDYILLDMASARRPIIDTDKGTFTSYVPNYQNKLFSKGYIGSYNYIIPSRIDKERITNAIDKNLEIIQEKYPQDKIILLEYSASEFFVNPDTQRLGIFEDALVDGYNESMSFAYNYAKSRLPNAHIIPFPKYIVGNMKHKWKTAPLHYIDEYYQYGFNAVELIIKRHLLLEEETCTLQKMCDDLSAELKQKYISSLESSVRFLRKEQVDYINREKVYLKESQDESGAFSIALDSGVIQSISKYFLDNNIKTCALFGFNAYTRFYCALLHKLGIFVAYIVENLAPDKKYEDITIVRKDAPSFPSVNLMLICGNPVNEIRNILDKNKYSGLIIDHTVLETQNKEETKA